MNLIKCKSDHFFDASRFDECPHCLPTPEQDDNITVSVRHTGRDTEATSPTNPVASQSEVTEAKSVSSLGEAVKTAIGDDDKTVSLYSRSMGVEPVVGWLICLTREHFGEDFRLKSGRNFIGRSADMDVVISKDNAISRNKHAIVVYEPKGRKFLAMPGESRELCYLNGEVVLTPVELNSGDKLSVGETDLMFMPCCGEAFAWEDIATEKN